MSDDEAGARLCCHGRRRRRSDQRSAPLEPSTTASLQHQDMGAVNTGSHLAGTFTTTTCCECHQRQAQRKRPPLRLAIIVVVLLISALTMPSKCQQETTKADKKVAEGELPASNDDEHMLSTRLPRQQFRLGLGPTTRAAALGSTFKLVQIHRARPQATGGGTTKRRGDSPGGEEQPLPPGPGTKSSLPRGTGKKISSATLKKLLSQTLPKSNLTAASSLSGGGGGSKTPTSTASGGSNFKFVFIQRANSTTGGSGKKHNYQATKGKPAHSSSKGDSLAASVSRQLASSLLYSAATTLINAGSSSPHSSLSTLADQSLASSSSSSSSSANEDATSGAGNQIDKQADLAADNDIKRLSGASSERPRKPAATKTRKSRPSKIYNLPVKFVANGQPNGHQVMFHSIKQHFATIKRLQAAAQSGVKNKTGEPVRGGESKRKKAQTNRITGTNSRLIYLPLKYLSNAKPTMLSSVVRGAATGGTRAAHKTSRHSD